MANESYVEDTPMSISSPGFGGSPILRKARVASGVAKVDSQGREINERTVDKDITQSKEFLEAFGPDLAAKLSKTPNNRAVNISVEKAPTPIPEEK